ncbi:conserved membrane hypothetical protein [Paraburkholderia caribensis]|uniref:hypothetical protein n=1 Tax=Paraburkholderia caribensis TaxID=75105 RepID=UPI001CB5EE93|nr:hypothetical protein [Paraburkholderia caribensis]CAG9233039.1 conserved membrane hypothetical protein [Paraburkholderia caribensis]
MSTLLGDYNRLLAIAIWVFFASGLLMLKPPGRGVAYLVPGRTRVRFPSWRAAFGRRLALFVSPIHLFWPMAEVDLLARSQPDAMEKLAGSARQLARPMRLARPLLLAVTCIVVVVIPAWVLTRGADLIFLGMAALAYGLYVAGLMILLRTGAEEDRRRIREHWRALVEPLLCLPYGAHLCRKLSERYQLTVPLVDVLRSDTELSVEDLQDLSSHLQELRDVSETTADLSVVDELKLLIDKRIAGYTQ